MKTFFHRHSLWIRLYISVVLLFLLILLPYIVIENTVSNGLGAGLFVLSIFCGIPFVSLVNGILAAGDLRRLWFLPAVPALVSLLLYPIPGDAYLAFRLTPLYALAAGYIAMLLCCLLLKRIRNKQS